MKALALSVLLLVGCGPALTSGSVTEKRDTPEHTSTVMVPQYITTCSGKPLICTPHVAYFLPITSHYNEKWEIHLVKGDKEGWLEVTQQDFQQIDVGDSWPPSH